MSDEIAQLEEAGVDLSAAADAENAADGADQSALADAEKALADAKDTTVKDISEMTFNEAIDYVFDIDDIELPEPQIDVFVVNDYDKFLELVDEGRLADIDIKYDRKVLTKYIHPTILSTTSIDGKTYGGAVQLQDERQIRIFGVQQEPA